MNEQNYNTQYNYNNQNKAYQPTENYSNNQSISSNRQATYGQQATSSQQYFQAADMTGNNNSSNPTYKPAVNMGNTMAGDDRLISPQEKVVATLGQNAVTSFATGDGWANRDVILTDKHLYYIHSYGILNTEEYREIVDIDDITGTKIVDINPWGWLIFGCIGLLVMLFGIMKGISEYSAFGGIGESVMAVTSGMYIGIPCIIAYFIRKKKFLSIEYPGGRIKFKLRRYKMEQVIEFQKSVHKIKSYRK